jgi:4,5-DOPA dioxygenase extradiol
MTRKRFLQLLSIYPMTGTITKLNELNKVAESSNATVRMPVLFLGHGSPMNAIEDNEFVHGWKELGRSLPKPNAVLCISAHWETRGTFVTAMEKPPTIHDFGGFPKELFDVQYPAPGSPELAKETKSIIKMGEVGLDDKWGLDHGCWSVIKHLYPGADVPVVQMSLDYYKSPQYHYDLARELAPLRNNGVLIVGSGNIVHNLGLVAWDKLNTDNYSFDWALEAKEKMKKFILNDDHKSLIDYKSQGKAFTLSIPTPEHYLPLLYALALKDENEYVSFLNDKTVAGSLAMTSLKIANKL